MIVEIPFVYTAHVVPPGKRNARETHVIGRVPVRVPTAEVDEMPVAFLFSPGRDVPWSLDGEALMAFHRARSMEVRMDDRGLWAPEGHDFDREENKQEVARLSEAQATALVESMRGTPFSGAQWGGLLDWQRRSVVREGTFEGRVLREDRRDRVANILAIARGVRFCDGRFWSPTTEPCWVGDGDSFPTAKAELSSEWRLKTPGHVWRADRVGHALADLDMGRGRGRGRGREEWTPKSVGLIDILIPEAVRLPVDEIQLVSAARDAVGNLKERLPEATVPFFMAFAELRDAAMESPLDTVSERLAAAVSGMLALRRPREDDHDPDWRLNGLEEANARWLRSLEPGVPDEALPEVVGRRGYGR